jgi:FkbM family methyltransferase
MRVENFFGHNVNVGSLLEEKHPCMDYFIKEEEPGYAEMKNFWELTKDRKNLLDVGCALGMYSLVFCNRADKVAHSFDASHETQLIIEQNIALNSDKHITYHKMFLGDKDAITPYNSDGFHAFAINGSDRVLMLRVDSFCSLFEFIPDTIKIDTEGYEYNILMGGKDVLMEYRPLMFIELHPKFCGMYGTKINQVVDVAEVLGYTIKDVNGSKFVNEQLYQSEENSIKTIWYPNECV